MAKLKVSFTVKVSDEVNLNDEQVKVFKGYKTEGKDIFLEEKLKQDMADTFGIDKFCVEVIEHSEELIEGIGE